jgi:branched-chain amino acid transport system ATP-binding protein
MSDVRATNDMLRVSGLNTYYGRAHILVDVGFALGHGEVVALLGRNGAGKSTTLKTIMGLVRPAGGRITLDDDDITAWPPHRIARCGLGYVPEDRRMFADLTVLENLEVGRRPPRGAGVAPWTPARLFRLFPNLAALGDRPAGQISGGEQQMLSIARTLMGNPQALLLDEPSEGLAPVIIEQLASTILELKASALAILLSEQNLRFARVVADRALVMERGRIRFSGSMAELAAEQSGGAARVPL